MQPLHFLNPSWRDSNGRSYSAIRGQRYWICHRCFWLFIFFFRYSSNQLNAFLPSAARIQYKFDIQEIIADFYICQQQYWILSLVFSILVIPASFMIILWLSTFCAIKRANCWSGFLVCWAWRTAILFRHLLLPVSQIPCWRFSIQILHQFVNPMVICFCEPDPDPLAACLSWPDRATATTMGNSDFKYHWNDSFHFSTPLL